MAQVTYKTATGSEPVGVLAPLFKPYIKNLSYDVSCKIGSSLYPDLIQGGYIGLIDAKTRFDMARGVPFCKYAAFRIRGCIWDEGRRILGFSPYHAKLEREKGKEQASGDVTKFNMFFNIVKAESIELHPGYDRSDDTTAWESYLYAYRKQKLYEALITLDTNDSSLIDEHYFKAQSQKEIAVARGVSEAYISLQLGRIRRKLKGLLLTLVEG